MKRILLITVCLVMILAGMSVFPGLIHSTIFSFLGFFTLLPLLGLWFFVVGAAAVRDLLRNRSVRSAFGVHAAALSGFVFVLVVMRIPLRLGFAVSRPSFERFILSSDIPDGPQTPTPTRWLGIFHSDRYARDSRGGVFFRTATGSTHKIRLCFYCSISEQCLDGERCLALHLG